MFGIVQPCSHSLTPELRRQWWGHLCGLCLALRDGNGQAARVVTNVDAVALSVLVEAQRVEAVATRRAGPCPMRGFRPATVVEADDPGVAHAVAVSLTMAATKLHDHTADGDGWAGRVPWVPVALARRWARAGDAAASRVGLDTGAIREVVAESGRRERRPGQTFDAYVHPTEEAAALVCRHTATLAGRPANTDALDRLGRAFGRTVYLLDAVADLADDVAAGHFNPLVAVEDDPDRRLDLGAELLAGAHRDLTAAFDDLDLPRPALARVLFVEQVRRAGERVVRAAGHTTCRTRREGAHGVAAGLAVVAAAGSLAVAAGNPWASDGDASDDPDGGRGCGSRCKNCCEGVCDCCECGNCCCDGCRCCRICDCDCDCCCDCDCGC